VNSKENNYYKHSKTPNDWEYTRLKNVLTISDMMSLSPAEEKILSLTNKGIVERDITSNKGQLAESYDKYILIKQGQICMNPMDLWSGWVDISSYDGLISPAYYTFVLDEKFDYGFINYFLQLNYINGYFFTLGRGVASHNNFGRWVLTPETLKNIHIYFPDINKQKLISRYLDKKTEKIDRLVEKIQKKIELLKEQRISLVDQCVTKGLDPKVEMKDSGVEWIGKIPKHWEITKLKYNGKAIIGLSFDKEDVVDSDTGTLVLRSSNVQGGKVVFDDNLWVKTVVPEKLHTKIGDILICTRNGSRNLIGKCCLLGDESLGMTWGVFMTVFRSNIPNFFHWMLNSQVFKSQSGLYLTSTINQLTVSTLENLMFPFIEDPVEQKSIIDFLDETTSQIDQSIENENKRTTLLKEYRQSLISSVVTGKVHVAEDML